MRVKSGVLHNGSKEDKEVDAALDHKDQAYRTGHVGFGHVETVGKMIKGGKYI